MLATLTLPAGIDLSSTQRTPTVRLLQPDDKHRGDPVERLPNAWCRGLAATMRGEPCAVRWGRDD